MSLSRFATQHIKAILFVTVVLCAIGAWLIGSFPVAITNSPHVVESALPQPTLKGQSTTFQLGSFTDSDPTNGPWTMIRSFCG